MSYKKNVIISAVNFFEGGPLSVFKDCLSYINNSEYINDYQFTALVHNVALFNIEEFSNVKFIAFPKSRKSYIYRLYYEYIYFRTFAKKENVHFWLSLHDITPNLTNVSQAVYCHNPSPFNTINYKDIYIQPTQFFFRVFYKYLYKINIKRNKFVVVQQLWIKNKFVDMFKLDKSKIIIAPPQIPQIPQTFFSNIQKSQDSCKIFFFPTFPRPFKNIEIICDAVKIILSKNKNNFKVVITIDGTENKYAKSILDKYKNVINIDFIGLIKREEVYSHYSLSDCLIFPSKLETWGLPISEFKQFDKPILVSDLAYAKETIGDYKKVNFFDVKSPNHLAELMIAIIDNKSSFDLTNSVSYEQPFAESWKDLFNKFLS
jgi:glycosyltransferase involved in cell wall biosynthesis